MSFVPREFAFPAHTAVPVMDIADLSVLIGFVGTDCSAFFADTGIPEMTFISFFAADCAFAAIPIVLFIPGQTADGTYTAVPAMAFVAGFAADCTLAAVPYMLCVPSGAASSAFAMLIPVESGSAHQIHIDSSRFLPEKSYHKRDRLETVTASNHTGSAGLRSLSRRTQPDYPSPSQRDCSNGRKIRPWLPQAVLHFQRTAF